MSTSIHEKYFITYYSSINQPFYTDHIISFTAPIRSKIPLSEFPDYVIEMTDEDDSNSTGLMREFSVSLIALAIIEVWCGCATGPCRSSSDRNQKCVNKQRIPSAPVSSYRVACLPHNENKNRFRNIFPCEILLW